MDGLWEFIKQAGAAALGSGVVFGLFKMFWEQRKEQGHRKERERHLALLIAQHLESFAITTAYKLVDDFEHWNSGGHAGTALKEHPRISSPPSSTDYQLLDNGLVDRLYALPLDCETSSNSISSAFEFIDDEDELFEVKMDNLLHLLKRVFVLAGDYRTRYGLAARPGSDNNVWDRERWVDDEIEWVGRRREERRQREADGWAQMNPPPPKPSN